MDSIPLTIAISLCTTVFTVAAWSATIKKQQDINTQDISDLKEDLEKEKLDRKDEYTAIQIELAKIDTNLLYIKKALKIKED